MNYLPYNYGWLIASCVSQLFTPYCYHECIVGGDLVIERFLYDADRIFDVTLCSVMKQRSSVSYKDHRFVAKIAGLFQRSPVCLEDHQFAKPLEITRVHLFISFTYFIYLFYFTPIRKNTAIVCWSWAMFTGASRPTNLLVDRRDISTPAADVRRKTSFNAGF